MAIHPRAVGDVLLNYAPVKPTPDPLTVSTDKDPSTGRLDLTIGRNMTSTAYCQQLTVKIPLGGGKDQLTTKPDAIRVGVTGGDEPGQGGGWTPGTPTTTPDGKFRVFTFKPAPGRPAKFDGTWALTLAISQIEINNTVGTVDVVVVEETSPTPSGYTSKDIELPVVKFPAGFVFRNLRPNKIMVQNGERITLSWDVQGATCEVFWGNDSQPNATSPWTSDPLHNVTGFMVQATAAQDNTLVHTLTTAVMVELPDLKVGDLDVLGTTRILRRHPRIGMPPSGDWRATTDGIAVVTYRPTGTDPGRVQLRIRQEGSDYHDLLDTFEADNVAADKPVTLSVPLQRGECLHYIPSPWESEAATLSWCSFGDGELEFLGEVPW